MTWLDDVRQRMKRGCKILFTKDSEILRDLNTIMTQQNHRTMALWALELAQEAADALAARHPDEHRPQAAITASRAWAAGRVKMPFAQRAILDAHAAAKSLDAPEDIALCHAIGQACGVVHTVGHAPGLPMYELTAIVRHYGLDACAEPITARVRYYEKRLLHWQTAYADAPAEWAGFMLVD